MADFERPVIKAIPATDILVLSSRKIFDSYTKEIIGYCVRESLKSIYSLKALDMATKRLKGVDQVNLIHHSDRGVQYASFEYIARLHAQGIRMTQSGNPKDNAVSERVNGIIKHELLKGMRFQSVEEVRQAVKGLWSLIIRRIRI